MPLKVSLPCRTSHTQIGSWKHLNTAPVQSDQNILNVPRAGASAQAALLDLLFFARLPAPMDMILPFLCSCSTLVRARNSSASFRYLACSPKGGGKERSSASRAGASETSFSRLRFMSSGQELGGCGAYGVQNTRQWAGESAPMFVLLVSRHAFHTLTLL